MYNIAAALEKHLPDHAVMAMYNRLSQSDREALRDDDIGRMSPDGQNELRVAHDYIKTKAIQPKLEAQQQELQQPTTGWRGVLSDVAAPIAGAATGVTRGAASLLNVPSYLAQAATGKQVIPQIPQPESIAKLGAQITGTGGLPESPIAEDIGGVLPSLAGGEALAGTKLAGKLGDLIPQTVGGALYGASQSPTDPITGAAAGGALGAAGTALGNLVIAPAAKALSKYAVSPLVKRAGQLLSGVNSDDTVASALGKAYAPIRDKANRWEAELSPLAQKADAGNVIRGQYQTTTRFKPTEFKQAVNDIVSKYQKDAKSMPSVYGDVISDVKKIGDNAPTSFTDALDTNRVINNLPSNYDQTNNTKTLFARKISNQLRSALKSQIASNAKGNPDAEQLLNSWNDHLANYKKLKAFDQAATSKDKLGNLKLNYSPSQAKMMGYEPDENISKKFIPSAANKSTASMEHFVNLVGGDPQVAKDILKKEIVAPAFNKGVFNPSDLLNRYGKMSQSQKDFLFNDNEKKVLDSAMKAKRISKIDSLDPKLISGLGSVGAGGLAGYYAGGETNENKIASTILGALGGHVAEKMFAKSLASPEGVSRISRIIENERGARRKLTTPLVAAAAPYVAGGGQ